MKKNCGQSMVFVLIFLLAISMLALSVQSVGNLVRSRIRLQNAADAAARTAAVWKARSFNEIAALNSAAIGCQGLSVLVRQSGFDQPEKDLWQTIFQSEIGQFANLSRTIADQHPWQAEADAYIAAYATLSGGDKPGQVPRPNNSSIPRAPYGGLVFTGHDQIPPDFGIAHNPLPAFAFLPLPWFQRGALNSGALGVLPMPIKAIAWYRGRGLAWPILDRFVHWPRFCFAQADANCPQEDGRGWLVVPSWRASLQRADIQASQVQTILDRAGIVHSVSPEAFKPEIIRH